MHDIRPFLPELFTEPGSLLYIGARIDAHSWLDELVQVGHQITLFDIWQQNLNEIEVAFKGIYSEYPDEYRRIKLVGGDVRDLYFYPGIYNDYPKGFDYVFWWHGPEHLSQNELLTTLQNLESKTNKTLALACPWGWYPQSEFNGNPYEKHQSTLYPKFFELLGFRVKTDGIVDQVGSEVVAWKRLV